MDLTLPGYLHLLAQVAQLPEPPADATLDGLRTAAEAAKTAAREAAERVTRLQAEIEGCKAAMQPRPDLSQTVADLVKVEIDARVRNLTPPGGHAKRIADARAAVSAAEATRTEAELLLPALESMVGEVRADAARARDEASKASALYGSAATLRVLVNRYLPALAAILSIEAEIEDIGDAWGSRYSVGTEFRNPDSGDKWTLRDLLRVPANDGRTAGINATIG